MTVDGFATILRDPEIKIETSEPYTAKKSGVPGWRVTLESQGRWYWYSMSRTDYMACPVAVADAITSPNRWVQRANPYKEGRGFEATVCANGHAYMLGHGNNQ